MATVASAMTMPAVARTARSLTTGNRAGRPQTARFSKRCPKLFQGDVSMCALSGLSSEELAATVVDWAIVDSLRRPPLYGVDAGRAYRPRAVRVYLDRPVPVAGAYARSPGRRGRAGRGGASAVEPASPTSRCHTIVRATPRLL